MLTRTRRKEHVTTSVDFQMVLNSVHSSSVVCKALRISWNCMRGTVYITKEWLSLQVCGTKWCPQQAHTATAKLEIKPLVNQSPPALIIATLCCTVKIKFAALFKVVEFPTWQHTVYKLSRWEKIRTTSSLELWVLSPANPPGFRRTGLFFPLQKRTLLKTLKMCLSHRDLESLLGLERLLLVATLSLLDSRAWRFWRIRELAMAAAISLRGGGSHQGQNIRSCSVSWD